MNVVVVFIFDRVHGIPTAAYHTNHVSRRATATTSARTKQLARSVYLPTFADAFKTFRCTRVRVHTRKHKFLYNVLQQARLGCTSGPISPNVMRIIYFIAGIHTNPNRVSGCQVYSKPRIHVVQSGGPRRFPVLSRRPRTEIRKTRRLPSVMIYNISAWQYEFHAKIAATFTELSHIIIIL